MSQNNLNLGIIGAGFVGSAVINGFNRNVEQYIVDPKINSNTIGGLVDYNPSITFVCVPTPEKDNGDVDTNIIYDVLAELDKHNYKGITVIKSTVTPQHLTAFKKHFGLKLVYNPEFLTEANSHNDFLNPHMQVLGGKWRDCDTVEKAYARHSSVKVVPTFKVDIVTASLIKYTINSWLSVKVTFFNELHDLFQASGAMPSWDQFTEMLSNDPRMGKSHMKVPGPDGRYGYGGHCFPKDTKALLHYAKQKKSKMSILKKSIDRNEDIRKN